MPALRKFIYYLPALIVSSLLIASPSPSNAENASSTWHSTTPVPAYGIGYGGTLTDADSEGNVAVTNYLAGTVTIFRGKNLVMNISGFAHPHDVAFDGKGHIYVAQFGRELGASRIGLINLRTGETEYNWLSGFVGVASLDIAPDGKLWVGDADGNTLYSVDVSTKQIMQIAGNWSGIHGVRFDDAGNLYAVSISLGVVWKRDVLGNVSIFSSGFLHPVGLAIDQSGGVYLAEPDYGDVVYVDRNGNKFPIATGIPYANGVTIVPGGLLVGSLLSQQVYKIAVLESPKAVLVPSRSKGLSVMWAAVTSPDSSSSVTYTATSETGNSCTTTNLSCDISGLSNGQQYSITVTASDGTYLSRPSVPVAGIPINPLVSAREGNKQVSLEVNTACLGGVPANFQYSTNGGFDWKAAVLDRNTNQIAINGLLNDVTYSVAFRSLHSGRFICDSEVVSVTPHLPVGVPGKMKINSVVLSRTNPSALVNAGFLSNSKVPLGYVEYTLNGGQSWTRFSGIRSPFRIADGLISNSSNSLQIRAVSRDGNGQSSDPFQLVIPDMKPGKVAIQNVKPLKQSFVINLKLVSPILNGPSDLNVYIDGNVFRLTAKSPAIIPAEFVNFQGLEAHTVQVSLINGWGEGSKSSPVTFKTQ